MRLALSSLVVAAATLLPSVRAGTLDAYTFASPAVTALQPTVTYFRAPGGSDPGNATQVGLVVGSPASGTVLTQVSGNTLNRVTLSFEFSVTDAAEKLSFLDPDFYLAGLPAECSYDRTAFANPLTISCAFRQTRPGFSFPAFTVFFNAPAKVVNGVADGANSDFISSKVRIVYAEGGNGADPSPPNSAQETVQSLVTLGTDNPIDVRSAVSKNGARLTTGAGGVPVNVDGKRHAELLGVPTLPGAFTVAEILITKVLATDPSTDGANCLSAGNFTECPSFQTKVADPFTNVETRFLDPSKPLATTYRVDAATLKKTGPKVLGAAVLYYTGNGHINVPIGACTNGVPRGDGLPCLASAPICYKNNTPGVTADLLGDCEWKLISTGNGLIKIQ